MWTERGIEVGYVLATAGEAAIQRSPKEARKIRAEEQRAACDIVGANHLRIWDFPDGQVEYGIELRRAIAGEIRAYQPDVIVSGAGELHVPWGLDHADHRAASLATIDAVRDQLVTLHRTTRRHRHSLGSIHASTDRDTAQSLRGSLGVRRRKCHRLPGGPRTISG